MGMMQCPECQGSLPDGALPCPSCGYEGTEPLPAVPGRNRGEIIRKEYEITAWDAEEGMVVTLGRKDKEALAEWMSDWDRFLLAVPELAQTVRDMCAPAGKEYVAKLTPEIRRLMEERKLTFKVDRHGDLMAALQDKGNVIRRQVRLEEIDLTPDVRHAVDNLYMTMAMNRILNEIQEIRDSINELQMDMHEDRLAAADAARDRFLQAQTIRDAQLRRSSLNDAAGEATKAKNVLMREFKRLQEKIRQGSGRPFLELLTHRMDLSGEADEALESLCQIVVCVEVECAAWSALEEYQTMRKSMDGFVRFAQEQGLDDIGSLLLIGEHSARDWTDVIEKVDETVKRIDDMGKVEPLPASEPCARITTGDEEEEAEETAAAAEHAQDEPEAESTDGDAADGAGVRPAVCRNRGCGKRLSGRSKDNLCEHCREEWANTIGDAGKGLAALAATVAGVMLGTRHSKR